MATDNSDKNGKLEPAAKRFNRGKRGTHPLDKDFQLKPEGVVEVLGGDELQTLTVTWKGDFSLFQNGSFWHDLEVILANCDKVMLRHEWDRHVGNGRDFPGDRTAEPFSELWYAGKIGFECWNLLNWHRVHGPNEIALSDAMRLGKLLAEAEWRAAFKPSILTGNGVTKGGRNGGDARAGKYVGVNYSILQSMSELVKSGSTVSRSAELTFKIGKLGTSAGANRALWYRNKEKREQF